MLRRLAHVSRDALVYGIAGALSRVSGLILLPLFTNYFTAGEYGIYQSVTNLGALLLSITVLGLDGATAILYFSRDDPAYRRTITTLWVLITVAVAVPVTLGLFLAAEWLSWVATGTPEHAHLFRLGVAALPFSVFLFTANNILRYLFRARTYAALNFGLTVAVAVAIVYLVAVAGMGLDGALWGTLAGTALLAIPGAWAIRDAVSPGQSLRSAEVWATARRMLQLGLPLVPASIALWVTNFSNTYFLLQLVGERAAGVFRIGAQLAALLSLVIWAFQLAWVPYSLSIAREADAPRTYSRMVVLFTAGTVGASVLLSALAPAMLRLLTTRDYAEAASVIGLLSLAAAASGAYQMVALGANLAQRTGVVAWTALSAAVTNVALNVALIPLWGMVGAGLASLAANLVSTSLVYMMSQRLYPIPYQAYRILSIWLAGGACVGASGVFNVAVAPGVLLSLGVAVLLVLFFVGVMFGLGIVTVREMAVLWGALKRRM
ncbi:MAG: oligosaccharide flippase family protein [Chloroflexia bacterium]